MSYKSRKLRAKIATQARHRCGYCQTQEVVSGIPLTIEHIYPVALGGEDKESNLWLSCRLCNEAKGILTEARDPISQEFVKLFNPHLHEWSDHFGWEDDGTKIDGRTPIGRATVEVLDLNSEFRMRSRTLWVEIGVHPPT